MKLSIALLISIFQFISCRPQNSDSETQSLCTDTPKYRLERHFFFIFRLKLRPYNFLPSQHRMILGRYEEIWAFIRSSNKLQCSAVVGYAFIHQPLQKAKLSSQSFASCRQTLQSYSQHTKDQDERYAICNGR